MVADTARLPILQKERSMGEIIDRIRARRRARAELKNPAYEIFIGILSLLSIMNLVFVYVLHGDTAMQVVLAVMKGVLSVIRTTSQLNRLRPARRSGGSTRPLFELTWSCW